MTKKTFHDFNVEPRICDALAEDGITEPFPIQELTLPVALDGHDVIGQARTGSGKTLGFGLPLLQRLELDRRQVQALIVTPTRELCLQVTGDLERAARHIDVHTLSVYGGVPIEPQTDALRAGVHVVVGTPGRLLDHVRRGNLDLSTCHTLVLDEADEMLDMGFLPDVELLINECRDERHTMLFSATMPTAVVNLARQYMDRPTFIRAEVEEHTIPDRMEQHFFLVHKLDKPRILARILQTPHRELAVVFTRTKAMADRLVDDLRGYDIDAIAIHGDLRQATRERNLGKFRSDDHRHDVLVATEVAARGLDIDELTHVINYDPPEDEKMYLHRVGRTARAGGKGVAVTFATFAEVDRVNAIRKALDLATEPLEETFSTSGELTERFELPEQTPWQHLGDTGDGSGGRSKSSSTTRRDGQRNSSRSSRSSSSKDARPADQASEPSSSKPSSSKPSSSKGSSSKGSSSDTSSSKGGGSEQPSATEPEEGIDGSTARRARTRTRTRGSDDGDSGAERSDRGGSDTEDRAGSSSNSGRKRARARRSGSGSRNASSDSKSGQQSRDRDQGGGGGGSANTRSDSARTRSQRSDSRPNGSSHGGRSDRDRPGGGTTDRVSEPAASGARSAVGDGEPGIVRRVKVEHLP